MHLKGDFTMKMTQQAISCAWCLDEQGEDPEDNASHGICEPHAEQILLDYYWQKLQSVSSYVETQAALFAQEEDE